MFKIIIGLIMVVGGLSGQLVLMGTNSGLALAGVGAAMVVWGIAVMVRSKQSR